MSLYIENGPARARQYRESIDLMAYHLARYPKLARNDRCSVETACPFCGSPKNFAVWEGGHFECWHCGAKGNGILDYLMLRDHLGHAFEAIAVLDAEGGRALPVYQGPPPKQQRRHGERVLPPAAWRERAERYLTVARQKLFLPENADILKSELLDKGLTVEVVRAAGYGYNDVPWRENEWKTGRRTKACDPEYWSLTPKNDDERVNLQRAILIPGRMGGVLYYVQQRTVGHVPKGQKRYHAILGSSITGVLYGYDQRVDGLGDLVIVEGQRDRDLAAQCFGLWANIVTLGSARATTCPELVEMARSARAWVCLDTDETGQKAAENMLADLPGSRLLRLPKGKDMSETWAAGVDLTLWALEHIGPTEPAERKAWLSWVWDASFEDDERRERLAQETGAEFDEERWASVREWVPGEYDRCEPARSTPTELETSGPMARAA